MNIRIVSILLISFFFIEFTFSQSLKNIIISGVEISDIIVDDDNIRISGAGSDSELHGNIIISGGVRNIIIENLSIIGGYIEGDGNFTIDNCIDNLAINNVYIENDYIKYCIQLQDVNNCQIDNLKIVKTGPNGGRGIVLIRPHNLSINNFTASGNLNTGINLFAEDSKRWHEDLIFSNIRIQKTPGYIAPNGEHGIYMHGFENLRMSNVYVSGWGENSSNYNYKFRDAKRGFFESLRGDGIIFVPSYANTGVFGVTQDLVFKDCQSDITFFEYGGDIIHCSAKNTDGNISLVSLSGNDSVIISGFVNSISGNSVVQLNDAHVLGDVGSNSSTSMVGINIVNSIVDGSIFIKNRSDNMITGSVIKGNGNDFAVYINGATNVHTLESTFISSVFRKPVHVNEENRNYRTSFLSCLIADNNFSKSMLNFNSINISQ